MPRRSRRRSSRKLRKLDTRKLPLVKGKPRLGPCVATPSKFVAIGLNYVDHAKESGNPDPRTSGGLLQVADLHRRPQRQRRDAGGLDAHGLGSRARLRHRPHGARRRGQGRDEIRRRLLPDQRRLRARVPDEAQRNAVEQGQGLRHLRPDRSVARHDRRDEGPAGSRHVARRQRRAQAARQYAHHDLRRRAAGRRRVAVHDAASGRSGHHRNAARRRHGNEARAEVSQGGRRDDARHRRASASSGRRSWRRGKG